ncbi:hypothetical protein ABKN59_002582 [Abortiporus biennis]
MPTMSDTDYVIDLTSSPQLHTVSISRRSDMESPKACSSRVPNLPKSHVLDGKTFMIMGKWMTISSEQAKELCKANGGRVVSAVSGKVDYIVTGAAGTREDAGYSKT